jgi:F0F1-type ATP synthase membrane subunit a
MEIAPEAPVKIFGLPLEGFNMATLANTWLIMALLFFLCWWVARNATKVPGRLQAAVEMFVEFFEEICNSTLGPKYGRQYMPFVGTIFMFVVIGNMIGAVPNFLYWVGWPGFVAPTQDLNTPLGLAIIVLLVVHISAIKIKGFRAWLWDFFTPSFPGTDTVGRVLGFIILAGALVANYYAWTGYVGAYSEAGTQFRVVVGALCSILALLTVLMTIFSYQLGRVPNVFMAPLNFVGELGKSISHPFRLYGNVFGGFVITVVLSELTFYVGLPPFLNFFFGIFIGVVQAFVFAMLALAYVAVAITE